MPFIRADPLSNFMLCLWSSDVTDGTAWMRMISYEPCDPLCWLKCQSGAVKLMMMSFHSYACFFFSLSSDQI